MGSLSSKPTIVVLVLVLAALLWEFLKETYWAVVVEAALEQLAQQSGMSRPDMVATATPYVMALTAASAIGWACYALGAKDRNLKSPIEILYHWRDPRHVQARQGLHVSGTRYHIEIVNRTTDRTLHDVRVTWDDTPFTRFIDSQVRQGRDFARRNLLAEVPALHPQTRHSIYLFGFDDRTLEVPNNEDVLGHASHFTVRAAGRDAAETTAEFEYSPLRFPKLLKVS